jgi:hypothetical protein
MFIFPFLCIIALIIIIIVLINECKMKRYKNYTIVNKR